MIGRRQAAFRDEYRRRISPWYHGWAHVALIYAIGAATMWYAVERIHRPNWAEWLVVPGMFPLSNIFERWIRRFIMHRPMKRLMGVYKRHTLAHHPFFTDAEPRIDTTRDFRITFFPPYALVTSLMMSATGAAVLALVWSENTLPGCSSAPPPRCILITSCSTIAAMSATTVSSDGFPSSTLSGAITSRITTRRS